MRACNVVMMMRRGTEGGFHGLLYNFEYSGGVAARHFTLLMARGRERRLKCQECHRMRHSSGEKPMGQHQLAHVWSTDSFLMPAKPYSIFIKMHNIPGGACFMHYEVIPSGISSCRLARCSRYFQAVWRGVRLF